MNLAERLLDRTPQEWAVLILALLTAIPIHEFAHAFVATRAGDPTPERQGRVTLDPLKHLDPLGTILILLAGFGWGRPVQVNPYNFRSPRWGGFYVAAAGPASNVLLALLLGVLGFRLGLLSHAGAGYQEMVLDVMYINLALAFFNLIPVPPLDGSKVLLGLLPTQQAIQVARVMDQLGMILLLVVVVSPVADFLIHPPAFFLLRVFTGY